MKRSGCGRKPASVQIASSSLGAPSCPAAGRQLELDQLRRDPLEQAEVEERHAAVVQQHGVARVRVAGELVVAVHAAEVEAEDDLAEAVALGLRQLLELLEAGAARRTR